MSTQPGVELAVIERGISSLKERAEAIIVRDQQGYVAACNLVVEGRSYIKDVKFKLGPGIESARTHLDFLRNQQTQYINPVEEIVKIAERKAEEWKGEERRKAEAEERRINEERRAAAQKQADEERIERERVAAAERKEAELQAGRARRIREQEIEDARKAGEIGKREADKQRKAAEDQAAADRKAAAEAEAREKVRAAEDAKVLAENVEQVSVRAAIPTVAGVKNRQNWKFRIVNPALVPLTYRMIDEVAIGRMVRETKDKKEAEAMCPGIQVFVEEGV